MSCLLLDFSSIALAGKAEQEWTPSDECKKPNLTTPCQCVCHVPARGGLQGPCANGGSAPPVVDLTNEGAEVTTQCAPHPHAKGDSPCRLGPLCCIEQAENNGQLMQLKREGTYFKVTVVLKLWYINSVFGWVAKFKDFSQLETFHGNLLEYMGSNGNKLGICKITG